MKSLPGLDPDGKRIVTSDDVLKMDTLPKDIVIVGAGAVGVEFASMFHDVGVKVTLLEYLPQIVPLEDAEVSKLARAQLHQARHDGHDQRALRREVRDRRRRAASA